MKHPLHKCDFKRCERGFALVIILSMIVLLTAVVLVFFSRATASRGHSNNSFNQSSAQALALGAGEMIIGDLKQEIINGSTGTVVGTGATQSTFYTPTAVGNAVPTRSAAVSALTGATAINNLIRTSSPTVPPLPAIVSATASAAMTSSTSANGRSISPAMWNSHYLVPLLTGTGSDSTPIASFSTTGIMPAWVFVSDQGPEVLTAPKTTVIGRYAYAIYDEGGLLDMNVAGFPTATTGAQTGPKSALAFADLSLLPTATGTLTQTPVDNVVGWRNNATAQPGGSFGSFTFDAAAATRYCNSVIGNQNGFTSISSNAAYTAFTGRTDQVFPTRQSLIAFQQATGFSQSVLQYMATFTRDLNQPSFTPNPSRPITKANLTDSLGNANGGNDVNGLDDTFNPAFLSIRATSAFTRNDGSTAVIGEPLVKKRFALNRLAWLTYQGPSHDRTMGDADMQALQNYGLTTDFLQQGTVENIKKYFGLTWDATGGFWAYDHGIVSTSGSNCIGVLSKVRDAATPREPDFFELLKAGLTCGSLAKGATSGTGGVLHLLEESSDFVYDTSTDYNIMQIGANIISQSTTDGYPTRIQFNNGTLQEFRGIKNLPYFYQVRTSPVISGMPNPLPVQGAPIPIAATPSGLLDPGSWDLFWVPLVWNPHDANSSIGVVRPTQLRIILDGAPIDANGAAIGSYSSAYEALQYFGSLSNGGPTGRYAWGSDPWTGKYVYKPSLNPASWYNSHWNDMTTSGRQLVWQGDNTALTFTDNNGALFREPTVLNKPGIPAGSNLALGPNNLIRTLYADPLMQKYWMSTAKGDGVKCLNDPWTYFSNGKDPNSATPVIGFLYQTSPFAWGATINYGIDPGNPNQLLSAAAGNTDCIMYANYYQNALTSPTGPTGVTYRVQYQNAAGAWVTYDQKYVSDLVPFNSLSASQAMASSNGLLTLNAWEVSPDPRTRCFGFVGRMSGGASQDSPTMAWLAYVQQIPAVGTPTNSIWVDPANNVLMTGRWDNTAGVGWYAAGNPYWNTMHYSVCLPQVGGWYPKPCTNVSPSYASTNASFYGILYHPGLLSQNNPQAPSNGTWSWTETTGIPQYYGDPDGVVRRAMGGYVPALPGASGKPATTTIGLPLATAWAGAKNSDNSVVPVTQSQSRPVVLNRPFRSVAELGYVFTGTPWKNLSMCTPESGAAALLDVFCIQPDNTTNSVVAGKVNLNTRQAPVLQAILAGAYADEQGKVTAMPSAEALAVANLLIARTSDTSTAGKGPLANLSELVGKYNSSVLLTPYGGIDGAQSFSGFSGDLSTLYDVGQSLANPTKNNITRFREAALRPLATVGQTRVWNLLIDIVAQTGRYPQGAAGLDQFVVTGESRYWLHVAIDRQTGNVIDEQLELVKK